MQGGKIMDDEQWEGIQKAAAEAEKLLTVAHRARARAARERLYQTSEAVNAGLRSKMNLERNEQAESVLDQLKLLNGKDGHDAGR